jgi:hypothetical protein
MSVKWGHQQAAGIFKQASSIFTAWRGIALDRDGVGVFGAALLYPAQPISPKNAGCRGEISDPGYLRLAWEKR